MGSVRALRFEPITNRGQQLAHDLDRRAREQRRHQHELEDAARRAKEARQYAIALSRARSKTRYGEAPPSPPADTTPLPDPEPSPEPLIPDIAGTMRRFHRISPRITERESL